MNAADLDIASAANAQLRRAIRDFVEYETSLLDERRFEDWESLFADEGVYWAPARHDQMNPTDHVSLFYDDRHTLRTRITRLRHPAIHCQDPISHCVRVVSSVRLESEASTAAGDEYQVSSRFVMLEDRAGCAQRVYGGLYRHRLRGDRGNGFRILEKKVILTNCDQSFPILTQPF